MPEMNIPPLWIAIGVGAIVLLGLAIRFAREIGRALIVIAGLGVAGVVAWAILGQATATRETARATQQVARVAQTANTGQALLSVAMILLIALVIAALCAAVYFYLRLRLSQGQAAQQIGRLMPYPPMMPQQPMMPQLPAQPGYGYYPQLYYPAYPIQQAAIDEQDESVLPGEPALWGW